MEKETKTEIKQKYFSVKEVSVFLGYSKRHVYDLIKEGEIPHYKINDSIKLDLDEVKVWMKEKKSA